MGSTSAWHEWFAWHPVRTDRGWRWLVTVRRAQWHGIYCGSGGWEYEAIN